VRIGIFADRKGFGCEKKLKCLFSSRKKSYFVFYKRFYNKQQAKSRKKGSRSQRRYRTKMIEIPGGK
jgi:hypothetical protein